MARATPPEVGTDEYEARLLAVFQPSQRVGVWSECSIEDAWLVGQVPDTELALSIAREDRPGCCFIYRSAIWTPGTDSNPEQQAGHIDISLMEWCSTLRAIDWTPGMTYDPHSAPAGTPKRRPGPPALDEVGPGLERLPWPHRPESDPALYEACLLACFRGDWPGFRARIEHAWLEQEHPDTVLSLVLRMSELPVERVIFRIDIWHKRELKYPDLESPALSAADIGGQLHQWYRTANQLSTPANGIFETRPAVEGANRRSPQL